MRGDVESVISAFRSGKPVLVFDSAFREQDMNWNFYLLQYIFPYEENF